MKLHMLSFETADGKGYKTVMCQKEPCRPDLLAVLEAYIREQCKPDDCDDIA